MIDPTEPIPYKTDYEKRLEEGFDSYNAEALIIVQAYAVILNVWLEKLEKHEEIIFNINIINHLSSLSQMENIDLGLSDYITYLQEIIKDKFSKIIRLCKLKRINEIQ